jgi:acyl-coenzyme A synthetase/AMP-(fatty) acid ligase
MKKFLVSVVTVAAILGATAAPAFADVIHSSGTTGQPVAVGSNTGSVQGQTNRSATGSLSKETNDGWKMI